MHKCDDQSYLHLHSHLSTLHQFSPGWRYSPPVHSSMERLRATAGMSWLRIQPNELSQGFCLEQLTGCLTRLRLRLCAFSVIWQYNKDLVSYWLKKIKNKIKSKSLTFSASFTLYLHKLNIRFVVWRKLMLSLMAWKRNGNPCRAQMILRNTSIRLGLVMLVARANAAHATLSEKKRLIEASFAMLAFLNDFHWYRI